MHPLITPEMTYATVSLVVTFVTVVLGWIGWAMAGGA